MNRFTVFFFYQRFAAVIAMIVSVTACGGPSNYPQAHIRGVNGKRVVVLRGKRLLMAHDPISAIMRNTYEDSVLLPLLEADGKLRSPTVLVDSVQCIYKGELTRQGKNLTVNLFYDNYRKDPIGWNGRYELVIP